MEDKYINKLAKKHGVKFRARDREEIIDELIHKEIREELNYLSSNFQYASKYFTLCRMEQGFPDISNTVEKFLKKLIDERYITSGKIGGEWKPPLKEEIQVCGIKADEVTLHVKLVEGRKAAIPSEDGYGTIRGIRAKYTVIVVHFNDEEPMIELRCSLTEQQKYMSYIMKALGFAKPYQWYAIPKLTKPIASRLYELLSAGVASRHISLPTSVGSMKFTGKKGVNLNEDQTYTKIVTVISDLNIPTDDIMDESCYFKYQDPVTQLEYDAIVQVDIKNSFFTFKDKVPDFVIKHVMDGIWIAILECNRQVIDQIAASNEE